MSARILDVVDVLREHGVQVALAEDQQMVEALAPEALSS